LTRHRSPAKKLKAHILKNYTKEKQYAMFVESILGEVPKNINIEDLPKVSIITSVYNGDEFIRPFLEDITRQSIFKDKCELVLVDANSPGNEEEVIREYMDKFPDNIVYKKLDKDPGIYGTWNIGVELATGDFLTNANLDDRKAVNSLERHAKELFSNEDIDLVYADLLITDQPNETFENNNSNNRRYNFPEFTLDNLKMVNMPHSNPMWRKEVHEKYGLFDDKYRSAGDWEMWLRAASQGSKFKKIEDVLGLYYFNPKGVSTNPENFEWKRAEETEVYEKYASPEK
jgi:glycosyltransferase involved in cell wall biosynthesis